MSHSNSVYVLLRYESTRIDVNLGIFTFFLFFIPQFRDGVRYCEKGKKEGKADYHILVFCYFLPCWGVLERKEKQEEEKKERERWVTKRVAKCNLKKEPTSSSHLESFQPHSNGQRPEKEAESSVGLQFNPHRTNTQPSSPLRNLPQPISLLILFVRFSIRRLIWLSRLRVARLFCRFFDTLFSQSALLCPFQPTLDLWKLHFH